MQASAELAISETVMRARFAKAYARTERSVKGISAFFLAAFAVVATMLASLYESFKPTRLSLVLGALLALHLMCDRRVLITRESTLYAALLGYMTLSIFWTPDDNLAMNTLIPGLNFLLLFLLFGSLATFYDVRVVLFGTLCGFIFGAGLYTITQGFPFSRPADFSYNAIAGMYLFGLFAVFAWACYVRHAFLCVVIAVVIMLHIAATTSIKTNLGVLLGAMAAAVIYFRKFAGVLRSYAIALIIVSGVMTYAIISNGALLERVESGYARVALGVEVLSAREDAPKGTSFVQRQDWKARGLAGWAEDPIFGKGAEAFRAQFGITSHSTPIDLLYNFGLIGLVLFYGVFTTVVARLYHIRGVRTGQLPVLVIAALTCYGFITLSGTMHYNPFLAIVIGTCVALLRRESADARRDP